jgi:hypothetical protein
MDDAWAEFHTPVTNECIAGVIRIKCRHCESTSCGGDYYDIPCYCNKLGSMSEADELSYIKSIRRAHARTLLQREHDTLSARLKVIEKQIKELQSSDAIDADAFPHDQVSDILLSKIQSRGI